MDFPAEAPWEAADGGLAQAIGIETVLEGKNRMDWFCEIESVDELLSYDPDFAMISALGLRGLVVTSRSSSSDRDFVSRFFAPQSGVDEDSVTGSAHCALAPYWSEKLGRAKNVGFQASRRGGFVQTEVRGDRVLLSGKARTVVRGVLSY